MATTTNYSWTTPDDTDLVKDGAAAIRTLGSSVDTTTKALNPSTTLGDIEYRSSTANTNTRLGIGTTGQILTVSGGVPAWATSTSGGMTLINTGGTTLSGSSVTISSIPGTYKNLELVVRNYLPANDAARLILRINANSGTLYAAVPYGSNQDPEIAADDTKFFISGGSDNSVENNLSVVTIPDYANSTTYKWAFVSGLNMGDQITTKIRPSNFNGCFFDRTTITSLQLLTSNGNFTSGTAYLYGVS
jgi:hypothetical protein